MASIRAFLGIYPKTSDYESKRQKLEDEYKAILDFENSKEFKRFNELNAQIRSREFANRKAEILALRFRNTEDFHKEAEFDVLSKSKPISLYYKVKDSSQLNEYYQTEGSDLLKNYLELEQYIKSAEFDQAKKEASLSGNKKFAKSDLGKSLQLFEQQKKSERIKGYYEFIHDKAYHDFESTLHSGLIDKMDTLNKEINSEAFKKRKGSLSKKEFKNSEEKKLIVEYKDLLKSRVYNNYQKLYNSRNKKYFEELHGTAELNEFENSKAFFQSKEFLVRKKEITSIQYKDTAVYNKLMEYEKMRKSKPIRNYLQFKSSKEFSNYKTLDGTVRIKEFEKLKAFVQSDKFIQKRNYYVQRPKKRWRSSAEYGQILEAEQLKNSDQFKWYFRNKTSKKFNWLETWTESFFDDFVNKTIDAKKWLTKYFYGEALLHDSYSLCQDKHYVTDGKNLDFGNSTLRILTKKETVSGKSWHPTYGFVTRDFGYTSGLINTGKSFRQLYGTFEAKIKFCESKQIQNAFWMVSKTMVPHIDIAKADKNITFSNISGNAIDLKKVSRYSKSVKRSKFTSDFYIYSLEWTPKSLVWRVNGVEVASTSKDVPSEPMYIVLSAGLHHDLRVEVPSQMEIDWIRCFYLKN